MAFHALTVALELVSALRGPLEVLRRHDPKLEDDIRRAARSVPLNVAEGSRRTGRDRLHHYRIAAGSADEVRAALQVALAFGYLSQAEVRCPLEFLDRELAMLWRLTHRRP